MAQTQYGQKGPQKQKSEAKKCSYVQLPCFLSYLSITISLSDVDLFPWTCHMDSPIYWFKLNVLLLLVIFNNKVSKKYIYITYTFEKHMIYKKNMYYLHKVHMLDVLKHIKTLTLWYCLRYWAVFTQFKGGQRHWPLK